MVVARHHGRPNKLGNRESQTCLGSLRGRAGQLAGPMIFFRNSHSRKRGLDGTPTENQEELTW